MSTLSASTASPSGARLRLVAAPVAWESLSSAERRFLLMAASSVVDDASVLVNAAAIDVATLVTGDMNRIIVFRSGRFAFVDADLPALVRSRAEHSAQRAAHGALARELRRQGRGLEATWHASQETATLGTEQAAALLRLAALQLERGAVDIAQTVSEEISNRASGASMARATIIAAKAALWAGRPAEAARWAHASQRESPTASSARIIWAARLIQRTSTTDIDPRTRLLGELEALSPVTASPIDRRILRGLIGVLRLWWAAPKDADEAQARLVLAVAPSHPRVPVVRSSEAPSPLLEAYVRLLQASFQKMSGDTAGSRATVEDAVLRLPVRVLGEDLVDRLAENTGGRTGRKTSAAASLIHERSTTPRPSDRTFERGLTRQEERITGLIAQGLSNRAIAESLSISTRTVEVHLTRIYRKLAVRTRAELIARVLLGPAGRETR